MNTALCLESANHGLGELEAEHSAEERVTAMRLLFISQAFGIVGAELARISVAFYELHLFGPVITIVENERSWFQRLIRNHQAILWANIGAQVIVNGICLLQVYAQCFPVRRRWDPKVPGHCMNPNFHVDFGYVQGGAFVIPEVRMKADKLTDR